MSIERIAVTAKISKRKIHERFPPFTSLGLDEARAPSLATPMDLAAEVDPTETEVKLETTEKTKSPEAPVTEEVHFSLEDEDVAKQEYIKSIRLSPEQLVRCNFYKNCPIWLKFGMQVSFTPLYHPEKFRWGRSIILLSSPTNPNADL